MIDLSQVTYSSHSVPKHPTTEDGSCTTTETFGFVIPSSHHVCMHEHVRRK